MVRVYKRKIGIKPICNYSTENIAKAVRSVEISKKSVSVAAEKYGFGKEEQALSKWNFPLIVLDIRKIVVIFGSNR